MLEAKTPKHANYSKTVHYVVSKRDSPLLELSVLVGFRYRPLVKCVV